VPAGNTVEPVERGKGELKEVTIHLDAGLPNLEGHNSTKIHGTSWSRPQHYKRLDCER
jgi:hypothetical protein